VGITGVVSNAQVLDVSWQEPDREEPADERQ
jgi:hypothetical protein